MMRIFFILALGLSLSSIQAAPGNGNGSGTGKGKAKGNSYARGKEKHEAAALSITNAIANDAGLPAENFLAYSHSLADTLGQLDSAALLRVFGEKMGKLP